MMDIREKLVGLIGCAPFNPIADVFTTINDRFAPAFIELIADHLIANGVMVQEWISVSERLPEPEQEVLVQCETRPSSFKYQCKAFYVPPKWLRDESAFNWDYECCNEYDEDADDYYVNEGWYERVHNWDDYNAVGIGDFVTHWMPLPTPPEGE